MNRRLQKGFTLIELLIVMAIIAVLAVGVLVGLDPIEQINRARDTTRAQLAAAVAGAEDRYYSLNEKFTWPTTQAVTPTQMDTAALNIQGLVTSGDLKNATWTQIVAAGNKLQIQPGTSTYKVCYSPVSKQFRHDANEPLTNAPQGWVWQKPSTAVPPIYTACAVTDSETQCAYLCMDN